MKNQKFNLSLVLAMLALVFVSVSCDSDDPEPVNEEEVITTLVVTFINTADPTDIVLASFTDLDGPGGIDGVTIDPVLRANATYTTEVRFLNALENPVEDITLEVQEEDDEHQVFYVPGTGLNLTFAYGDEDGNGDPVGLTGTTTTGDASTGTLAVALVHEPMKSATGVSSGDITNAGGEEDIRVNFSVTVQ